METYVYEGERLNLELHTSFLSDEEADELYDDIMETIFAHTKTTPAKRANATYGDEGVSYKVTFRGKTVTRVAIKWTPLLYKYKKRLEKLTGTISNYCVVQLYPTGLAHITPHRDKEMKPGTNIAGVSIGATRVLKMFPPYGNVEHKVPLEVDLPSGSLYILKPPTNDYWCHSITKDPSIKKGRISITYRYTE
jgi:alkylated DNA repair dioxygenase AlkB